MAEAAASSQNPGVSSRRGGLDQEQVLEELRNRARSLGAIAAVAVASYPTPWVLTPTLGTREPALDEPMSSDIPVGVDAEHHAIERLRSDR